MAVQASKIVRTMCPMSCHPTLCGMLAEVRDGKLVGVRGDEANPDSRGFLCVRGKASRQAIENPARLMHPLIRDRRNGGAWRRADWSEALDRMASSMQAVGPEAVGLWPGHGVFTTNYGTRLYVQLLARFANFYGCQTWSPAMICWGLGGFGLGITGVLESNTKEDLAENARFVLLWGANLASQPNTARHLLAAKRRGATVVAVDVRRTEAAAQSDEVILIRPGTDTALALAMMHTLVAEGRYDRDFVARHAVGFDELARHVRDFSPDWAAEVTGIPAQRIAALARRYAESRPAMIVLGGSSMHKGENAWQAARAIACLPGLTGNLGIPGGGLGPRHGGASHGQGVASIRAPERRPAGPVIPSQMSAITDALHDGRLKAMFLPGTDMLSSFADTERVAAGLHRAALVVSYDLFQNDTSRRCADIVLPATAWLEELGCKITNTHVYLMERALDPPGETRSLTWVLKALAERLNLAGFYPWASEEAVLDAILDHPSTGHATVASLRAQGGIGALQVSPVGHATLQFDTPSGKIEFYSARAEALGLAPLPSPPFSPAAAYPLRLSQGRTLAHFHGFYGHGRALPALAALNAEAEVWMAPSDAQARRISQGAAVRVFNGRGTFRARAQVTDKIPAGVVWTHDGWEGLNNLTSGRAVLPDAAVDVFAFSAGQAAFGAQVEITAA